MKKLFVIIKNELLRYFISPLAYVYLIAFLLLNGSFALYFGNFFERGSADLSSMFAFQPWLYLLFIPGISMRLWSEEFRAKTIVQIMTMPVPASTFVWGKFFASWLFCALALILTFPFWITVNILGTPDNNIIILSYVGSFILAGCMLAISQTMSALTKNQVIALVLSVVANLLFFLSGLEYVLSFVRLFLPFSAVDMIASFSFLTHFNTIINGLIELRDIIFFASIILLFNFTTILIVSFKTSGTAQWLKSTSRSYYIFAFFCLILGFGGINLLANNLTRGIALDCTEEKIFTLTDTTKNTLRYLPRPITAKLYYSPVLGERNPDFRLMFDKVRLLLRQYAALSNGKFSYRIYTPEPLDETEDKAITAGLQPFPVADLNINAFFGLTLTDSVDNKQSIPFFALERRNFAEQDITQKIFELTHPKKNLGIITTLPVFDTVINNNVVSQEWQIIKQLKELYNITNIKEAKDFPDNLDVLMIINPQNPKQDLVNKIKNYSANGGKILLILDNAAEAPRIFSPINHEYVPSYLGDLADFWGIRFRNDIVVTDLDNSIMVDATQDYKNNPSFTRDIVQFILTEKNVNPKAPVVAKLKNLLFSSASEIEPASLDINFEPLITTSKNAAYMDVSAVYQNINPGDILRSFRSDNISKIIAAKITSNNPNNPFELIAVADSDFLYDSFWTNSVKLIDGSFAVPVMDNGNFVLNALEDLSGGDNLIGLRGKSAKTRRFEDIEKIRRTAQLDFKVKENEIIERINRTKAELQEIWSKKNFEQRQIFTADELSLIAGIRKRLENDRKELSQIRKALNAEINAIDTKVKIINIYAVPLLILCGLLLFSFASRRKAFTSSFRFNDKLMRLLAGSLLLLGAGIASVYLTENREIESYENQPVFKDLKNKINDIHQVIIQNNQASLDFYLKDGEWQLKGYEDFPVYQERVRSFLSALLEAVYYEKKSDRGEDLNKFGLAPQEVPNSQNIRIELKSADGKNLTAFNVGKYDQDIGRGAKAAYIKFDDKFQVWLIAADFIDLEPTWQNWTYSTLWNLRFGRLAAVNKDTDTDKLANLARVLLNTYALSAQTPDTSAQEILTLNLEAEGNNQITLHFYQKDSHFFAAYDFGEKINGKHLQTFADSAKNKFFAIKAEDMEKIQNALNSGK